MKQIKYRIINEFNTAEYLSKEDLKLLFNKKLLNVILATQKNEFEN